MSVIAIVLIGALYILLPSSNNTLDSLAYASDMRDGINLFRPHHLLYNAFGYGIIHVLGITKPLPFMCFINAIFAIGCLIVIRSIIKPFTERKIKAALIILSGASFGFMRFAIDNETYIVPLFFSLLASRLLLYKKNVLLAGFLAATACLFHQIYFFWWIGLLIFIIQTYHSYRKKNILQYIVAALIVPTCYILVFFLTTHDCNTIFEFIFHDYVKKDYVSLTFKPATLLLAPINLIRTFFQVHGYFLPLLQRFSYLWIGAIVAVFFLLFGVCSLKNALKKRIPDSFDNKFAFAHLNIFLLQFLFAFLSDGNAEFMLMLPFVLCIFLIIKYELKEKLVIYAASGLFFWNLTFGLLPYHFYELSPEPGVSRYIQAHPDKTYLVRDKNWVKCLLLYYYPEQDFHLANTNALNEVVMDSLVRTELKVFTDLINNETFMSRSKMVSNINNSVLEKYKITQVDSIKYDIGKVRIYSIE
jgi:hypothetical protein